MPRVLIDARAVPVHVLPAAVQFAIDYIQRVLHIIASVIETGVVQCTAIDFLKLVYDAQ